ncbi:hypothetical protein HHK36_016582 [Tetracentron sinense]|uniref:MLO-like protein n=1 Tax=Tetracentron sinense TaxID=13715 RepID=A0A834Z312_TETSI|nr:hypothetical protein HHK36_016582 [Tetracentron sinense]
MAAEKSGRSLEETPTWAVAVVCFVLVAVSILIEHFIHLIGMWLKKKHKKALYESLEKVKSELMLMGFISLLLTVGQGPISNICISESLGNTWKPCTQKQATKLNNKQKLYSDDNNRRRLLLMIPDSSTRRGKVSFVSTGGIHQLHIFIFVLAVFHVLYCVLTMALGRAKMRRWKSWEKETRTIEYQSSHGESREVQVCKGDVIWKKTLELLEPLSNSPLDSKNSKLSKSSPMVSFFRQFFRSVTKVDFLTLRHGFINAHLAPQSHSQFDFQKYIRRSLEEDFIVVVGISPTIWLFAVLFLLFNTHGWYSYLWLPFLPLIIILMVGTKLQVIITKMALRIHERGEVVKGGLVVQPGDDLFWFNRPRLVLHLINFVLFQNAFQLAFFAWTWYEFGLRSCFHEHLEDVIIRITMGVVIQILCSYVTLPLYALVTQMGSSMKPTIFNDEVATALRTWHHTAKKNIKENRKSGTVSPMSSMPTTPTHGMSPVHLLRGYRNEADSAQTSPRTSNFYNQHWENEESPSPSHHYGHHGLVEQERDEHELMSMTQLPPPIGSQHEIDIESRAFSFNKVEEGQRSTLR